MDWDYEAPMWEVMLQAEKSIWSMIKTGYVCKKCGLLSQTYNDAPLGACPECDSFDWHVTYRQKQTNTLLIEDLPPTPDITG